MFKSKTFLLLYTVLPLQYNFPTLLSTTTSALCMYSKNIVIGFLFDPLRHHRHLVILEVMVCVVSVSAPATLQSLHYRSQELLFLPASAKICWSRYQRHKRPAMPYLNAFFFLNILAWFTPFFFSLSQVFKCFEVCLTDCCNDFWEDRMRLARV